MLRSELLHQVHPAWAVLDRETTCVICLNVIKDADVSVIYLASIPFILAASPLGTLPGMTLALSVPMTFYHLDPSLSGHCQSTYRVITWSYH